MGIKQGDKTATEGLTKVIWDYLAANNMPGDKIEGENSDFYEKRATGLKKVCYAIAGGIMDASEKAGGEQWFEVNEAAYTVADRDCILANTLTEGITFTVPDDLEAGSIIKIKDYRHAFEKNGITLTSALEFYHDGEIVSEDVVIKQKDAAVFLFHDGDRIHIFVYYQGDAWKTITEDYTVSFGEKLLADTSEISENLTLTVDANIPAGSIVEIRDYKGTFDTHALILTSTLPFIFKGNTFTEDSLVFSRKDSHITLYSDGENIHVFERWNMMDWYYIKKVDGTAIKNGDGTLRLEVHRIISGIDEQVEDGDVKLYDEEGLEITEANGYQAGSDGYVGIFGRENIDNSLVVKLIDFGDDAPPEGDLKDAVTLVDVYDGPVIDIQSSSGLVYVKDKSGSWNTTADTVLTAKLYVGTTIFAEAEVTASLDPATGNITMTDTSAEDYPHLLTLDVSFVNNGTRTATAKFESLDMQIVGYEKVWSVVDGEDGLNASTFQVLTESYSFKYNDRGDLDPAGQTITLSASYSNVSGTVEWSGGNLPTSPAPTGDNLTIDPSDLTGGSTTFTATLGDFSDSVTIYKLYDGEAPLTLILTNEVHAVPADKDGDNEDFAGASTGYLLYEGTENVTGSASVSIADSGNVTYTHSGGTVTVTAMSADTATIDISCTYKGITRTKTFSLSKSKQGLDGSDGLNGADGVDGQDGVSIRWKGSYASHPSSPSNGWAYRNTTDGKSYVYQDGTWYQMTIDGTDGQDGDDGLDIVWKGESSSPPASPEKNWVYRDTDNGRIYIYNGSAWELMVLDGSDGTDGTNGTDGLSVFITYHDNDIDNPPSTPIGDGTSDGWHTNATSSSKWMSQKVASSASSGTWGSPIQIKGEPGSDGSDGIYIRFRGPWDSDNSYTKNNTLQDLVEYDGNMYICTTSCAPGGSNPTVDTSRWDPYPAIAFSAMVVDALIADQASINDIFSTNITATGTITGAKIQTSGSDQRVVIDNSGDKITFYDDSGNSTDLWALDGVALYANGIFMADQIVQTKLVYENSAEGWSAEIDAGTGSDPEIVCSDKFTAAALKASQVTVNGNIDFDKTSRRIKVADQNSGTANGGNLTLEAGDGVGTDADGGDVIINPGAKTMSGNNGVAKVNGNAVITGTFDLGGSTLSVSGGTLYIDGNEVAMV